MPGTPPTSGIPGRLPRLLRAAPPVVAGCLLAIGLAGCGDSAAGSSAETEAVAGSSASAPEGPSVDELVFAAVPSEESTSLAAQYENVMRLLSDETGIKVTFQQATDYAAVIEGQRAGKIDIAQFGPFSYVIADAKGADITPVVAGVANKGDQPGYQSYGIVPAGSDIKSLDDYAGKKVCFVDPASTSGFLFPSAGLHSAGLDPSSDVEGTFAGGHDASALAVASGQCDAGFAYDSMVDEQLIEKGSLEPGELKVIWKSDVIPASPITVRNSLPDQLFDTIAETLRDKANVDYLVEAGYCDDAEHCAVGEEGEYGYVPVDDSLYDAVRKVCDSVEAETCEGV